MKVIPPECDKEHAVQPLSKSPTHLAPCTECAASSATGACTCTPTLHGATPTQHDVMPTPTPSLQNGLLDTSAPSLQNGLRDTSTPSLQNGLLDTSQHLKSASSSTKKRTSAKWSSLPLSPEANLDPLKYQYIVQDVALPSTVLQVQASQLR